MTIPNDEMRSMGPGASQGPAPGAQTAATGSHTGEGPRPPQWDSRWAARNHRSPVLAALLSMFPGLGQIYLGDYNRGFLYIGIFVTLVTSLCKTHGLEVLLGISLGFFILYNIIDTARRASLYNQAIAGIASTRPPIPEDFKLPSGRGSLFWGAVVLGLGVILLLNTRFDVDFYWLEDWWPAFIILIGLNLLYKAVRKR